MTSAFAPGRVNLIGEHTDYNGGLVMPMALTFGTTAAVALRDDGQVRVFSSSVAPAVASVQYQRGAETKTGGWIDYVQGVTRALDDAGYHTPGFDLSIHSTLPLGGGLASSASLEVSVLRALRDACQLPIDDVGLAMLAHRAETGFVGAPVGVMDQMVSSLAGAGEALFIDTATLETARVPMPDEADVVIIDSGLRHQHASGDYRVRREECERAAALLGVSVGALAESQLDRIAALPEPLGRRARHVVTENARVRAAVVAMRNGALDELGRLWTASHASMRDDFDVSLPEIDALVEVALTDPAVFGARLTGGGFGGAVIVLTTRGAATLVAQSIQSGYLSRTGLAGRVISPLS